jgi:succinoglycan biosynthesis protein ExoA
MSAPSPQHARTSSRRVLVVIPCLNEEEHVEGVVAGLLKDADALDLKVVIADGGSTDGTRAIAERLARQDKRVLLLDNPKKIQSAAVNEAVRVHGEDSTFLIRLDAHADYPARYCERLLATQETTGADSVVVSMRTEGHSCFQRAAAAAQNSLLGNGGSAHRNAPTGRFVDHGHHALMRLSAYEAVGGYDEAFSHNEDAELDVRLVAAGYRIYLMGDAAITYYPRRSPVALFRQYFRIGRGRAQNALKHRKNTKLRHLVLVVIAPALCLVLLAPLSAIFVVPALAWAVLCLGYGLLLGLKLRDPCAAAAGIAAMATQAGWSFGFFAGLGTAAAGAARQLAWRGTRYPAPAHRPDRVT